MSAKDFATITAMPKEEEDSTRLNRIGKIALVNGGVIAISDFDPNIYLSQLSQNALREEELTAPIIMPIPGQESFSDLVVDPSAGSLYIGDYKGRIVRFDPSINSSEQIIELDKGYPEKMQVKQGYLLWTSESIVANAMPIGKNNGERKAKGFVNPEGTYIHRLDGYATADSFILVANGVDTQSHENNLVIWDAENGTVLMNHIGILPVRASAFDKVSGQLFIGYGNGRIDTVQINGTTAEFVGDGVHLNTEDNTEVTHLDTFTFPRDPSLSRLLSVNRSGLLQIRDTAVLGLDLQDEHHLGSECIELKIEGEKIYAITSDGKVTIIDSFTKKMDQIQLSIDNDMLVSAAQITRDAEGGLVAIIGTNKGTISRISLPSS